MDETTDDSVSGLGIDQQLTKNRYKTSQTRVMLIPAGPKQIFGYDPYKRFLEAIRVALSTADPGARITIG